ncbi:MAG: hypothetical protein M3R00_06300, partial [Pseudomonadota bacterium]|nr:hypothetical protein [Pseudomonadota bacterium]
MNMKRILERLKPGNSDKSSESKAGESTPKPESRALKPTKAQGSAKPARSQKGSQSPAKASSGEVTQQYERVRPPVPEVITIEYLDNNFSGLEDVLDYKEVKENTKGGLRMIEFILTDPFMFARWLGMNAMLKIFLKVFPEKQQQCVDNILMWKDAWSGFLEGRVCLFGFMDNCPQQRRQILDFVFAHKEIYARLTDRPAIGEFLEKMELIDREEKLEGEASYRHKVMMILASDVALYNNCITGSDDFWKYVNDEKNAAYREAFFMHHITNDQAHRRLFGYRIHNHHDGLITMFEKFNDKKEAMLKFILSTPERFRHTFPNLTAIHRFTPDHETNNEQKQLRQRLFEHALTIPDYEKGEITLVSGLSRLYDAAPDFGKHVVAKMTGDPEWLMKICRVNNGLEELFSSERYKPLKETFIANIYLDPKRFLARIPDESVLNLYISVLPEEEANLRHYYG